jgi:hypothetical protein
MDWFCWENLHRKLYMVFTPSNWSRFFVNVPII